MKKALFDVDDTLIDFCDNWNQSVVNHARAITDAGGIVYVWSGGGEDYAALWGRRLMTEFGIPVAGAFAKSSLPEVLAMGVDELVDDQTYYYEALESDGLTITKVVRGVVQ